MLNGKACQKTFLIGLIIGGTKIVGEGFTNYLLTRSRMNRYEPIDGKARE